MTVTGMEDVADALKAIAQSQSQLLSAFESVSQRVSELEKGTAASFSSSQPTNDTTRGDSSDGPDPSPTPLHTGYTSDPSVVPADAGTQQASKSAEGGAGKLEFPSRVILTTYPKQIGINPLPLEWGLADPLKRGPVAVSRNASTIRRRNAIGAHGGSYSIYYALAVASRELEADHKPDFTNTEPAVDIGPFPQWGDKKKIVAMDPWGHQVPWVFKDIMEKENGELEPFNIFG